MSPRHLTADEIIRLQSARTWILNHLHKAIRKDAMARHAGMSTYQFHDGFRQLFGMTFQHYVHEARMQTAKLLLRHTDRSVKDIAITCGYSTIQNFSKQFSRYFGISPRNFRESLT